MVKKLASYDSPFGKKYANNIFTALCKFKGFLLNLIHLNSIKSLIITFINVFAVDLSTNEYSNLDFYFKSLIIKKIKARPSLEISSIHFYQLNTWLDILNTSILSEKVSMLCTCLYKND